MKNKTFLFRIGTYNSLGGAETKAITLAEILQNDIGAKIIFLASGGTGNVKELLENKGFKAYTFPYEIYLPKHKKIIQTIKQILFLRKLKPDFILPWSSPNCKAVLPFWKLTGARYMWWNMQDEGRGLYKTKREEKLINSASDIISNSIVGKDFLLNNYDIKNKNIVLYNNPTPIPNKADIIPFWRKKLFVDENTIMVSMFANLTPFKDHKTLFKAWKIVLDHFSKKNQKIRLVLAGDQREMAKELKILGFDLKIAHTVDMVGSILEVNELMLESDLVVHSSNTEGCPNAVCEAMALGKSVVATDIPGDREALSDKYEQYTLSRPNNPEDLAQKLIFLMGNKDLANEIAQYNHERIKTEYTLEGMVNTLFPLFTKAV